MTRILILLASLFLVGESSLLRGIGAEENG